MAKALLTLLTHSDADYRLIAATIFAELGKETKDIDLALLDSFINDARVSDAFLFDNIFNLKFRFSFELNVVIR